MNPTTLLNVIFLSTTLAASIIYYKRIRKLNQEYDSKRDLIKNITWGITRNIYSSIKKIENEMKKVKVDINNAIMRSEESLEKSDELEKNVKELAGKLDSIQRELLKVKEQIKSEQIKVEMPIPLDDKKVLNGLNETELKILMILDELEEGTVPEIRGRINKTREHTARLLKKLYDRGFIDRNTSSIPYRYYLRKEVKEIIKRGTKDTKTINV